jgi:hypothetical protein
MPSPRPITGIFAPLKKKIVNKNIKASGGNVKVVASTPDIHRKSLNAMEQTRVNITKSGALARGTAKPIEAKNSGTKAKVVTVNSNMGGLTGTKKIGGGGGFFGLPKNR